MIPGKKLTPLALAVMGALSSLSAMADTFNNPSGDIIDYQYTSALLGIGTGDGNSGKVVISGNGEVTADTLQVGISNGTGVLDIINGGRLTVLGTSNLGGMIKLNSNNDLIEMGGESTVNVSGTGSQFNSERLIIGANGGVGTLNITDGGKVNASSDVIIAEFHIQDYTSTNAQGIVVVDGAGSELNAGGDITVGQADSYGYMNLGSPPGYGALTVTNGAKVHADGTLLVAQWSGYGAGYDHPGENVLTINGIDSVVSSFDKIQIGINEDPLALLTNVAEGYIIVSDDATLSAPSLQIGIGSLVIGGNAPLYYKASENFDAGIVDIDNINFINVHPENNYIYGTISFNHSEDDYQLKSNISGKGAIYSNNGTTTLSGDNALFIGDIYIREGGIINVTEQKNLGDAWISLRPAYISGGYYDLAGDGGRLNINATQDWAFINQLDGAYQDTEGNLTGGTVAVDTSGNQFSFKSADLTSDFTGTLALGNTQFSLDGVNTEALSQMLLKAGDQSVITLGQGQQTIDRFAFDGGTVIFGDVAPGKTRADNLLHTTSRLDLSGSGQVQVNLTDVVNSTPALPTDVPLLAQDDGNALIQLASSDGSVIGSGGNLMLTDSSGNVISSGVVSDIVQNGVVAAHGTYDYRLTSGTDSDGLYVNYGLKGIELLTAGSEALVLDAAGGTGNAADLSAQITGSGDLAVTGLAGEVVSLSNSANDYTGVTDIRSGTLAMFNSHVLGNTQALTVADGAGLNMNGHAQTVGRLEAAAGAVVNLNGGELTLAQGGTAAGALTGDGHLVVAGGTLTVSGANTPLTAQTTVADGATAVLDDAQGLGSGDISLAGTLGLKGAEGIFANSLSQQGQLTLTGSQVTLAGDNSAFAGHSALTQAPR